MMKKILVAEDNLDFLNLCDDFLSECGYQVFLAKNGNEALSLIRSEPLDLILSDVKMPQMDAIELLHWLKKNDKKIPVILMTGFSRQVCQEHLHELGAAGLLHKPFSLKELKEALIRVLPIETLNHIGPELQAYTEVSWSNLNELIADHDLYCESDSRTMTRISVLGVEPCLKTLELVRQRGLRLFIKSTDR